MVHFGLYGKGRNERWRCIRCMGEAVTRRHQRVRRMLVSEAGGRCAVCGYGRTILNLHFHHVDPASKSFEMTAAAGKSAAAYRVEAAKCVLVCANCHGEIESGLIPSPPAGARFGERWDAPTTTPAPAAAPPSPPDEQLTLWREEQVRIGRPADSLPRR